MFDNTARVFGKRIPVEEAKVENPMVFDEVEKKKIPNKLYSTTSKFLFREINLFIPEVIGIAISFLACIGLILFGMIFNDQLMLIMAAVIPMIVLIGFFMARMLFFTPNKHRHLTYRILDSGAIRESIDDYHKGEVPFDKSPLAEKIKVINPKKHIDFSTGRPVVFLKQGMGENISLNKLVSDEPYQSKELHTVIDSVWGLAEAYTRYNLKKDENKNMTMLIIIIMIVGVGFCILGWFLLQNNGMLEAALKSSQAAISVPGK